MLTVGKMKNMRAELVRKAKAIYDKARVDRREFLNAEERKQFDKLTTEARQLGKIIESRQSRSTGLVEIECRAFGPDGELHGAG